MKNPRVVFLAVTTSILAGLAGAQTNPSSQAKAADRPSAVAPMKERAPAPIPLQGEALYRSACLVCHMADGSGVPGMQPSIAHNNPVVVGEPATLIKLMLRGGDAALSPKREPYANRIPTFDTLSDNEIAAVLSYVRSALGNTARSVSATQVAASRQER